MDKEFFDNLFEQFSSLNIAVIGDVMLDTYWWGKTERISPEAPVPIVAVSNREQRIGGAGNVALNIKSLGASVQMISIVGDDEDGEELISIMRSKEIGTGFIVKDANRITTNKIRIISRGQHMMRLDAEIAEDLNPSQEDKLIEQFETLISNEKINLVILEDYNKGVLTELVIEKIIQICKYHNILIAVDPKRKNFFAYKSVDIFKPNLQEVKSALNIISEDLSTESLSSIHKQLQKELDHKNSFITLSEKGVYVHNKKEQLLIPTHIRKVADVSGAGDTVIAVAAVVYAATENARLMGEVANIAGGLVCEEVGTVAINKKRLHDECVAILANPK